MPFQWLWLGGFLEGFSPPDGWLNFGSEFVGQNTPPSGVLWYNLFVMHGTVKQQSRDKSIVSRRATAPSVMRSPVGTGEMAR